MYLIGPISSPLKGKICILAATENFTKWSEAISLRKATSKALREFVIDNIICRFGIPRRILSDNGTPFIGQPFELLMREYQIYHGKSTRHYPKGNGLIEVFNKILVAILGQMIKEASMTWEDCLSLALWAYRTIRNTTTKQTSFSLGYGAKSVLLVKIRVPSARMLLLANQ